MTNRTTWNQARRESRIWGNNARGEKKKPAADQQLRKGRLFAAAEATRTVLGFRKKKGMLRRRGTGGFGDPREPPVLGSESRQPTVGGGERFAAG